MEGALVTKLMARIKDGEIAQRLVDAGFEYPAQIRSASDKEIREALKGIKGVKAALEAVRQAYPRRK